jgi:hypothetical protein
MTRSPFLKWDFHDDCPDYDRILIDWGWIKKPPPISMENLSEIIKNVWNNDSLTKQLYAESPLLKMLPPPPPKRRPWWKFW